MNKLPEFLVPRCPRWADMDLSTLPYGAYDRKSYVGLSKPWKSNDKYPACGKKK